MLGDQTSVGHSPNGCLGAVCGTDFSEDSFDMDLNSRLRNFDLPRDELVGSTSGKAAQNAGFARRKMQCRLTEHFALVRLYKFRKINSRLALVLDARRAGPKLNR